MESDIINFVFDGLKGDNQILHEIQKNAINTKHSAFSILEKSLSINITDNYYWKIITSCAREFH